MKYQNNSKYEKGGNISDADKVHKQQIPYISFN